MQNNIILITSNISKTIIRSYARRRLRNPGIQKRLDILEEKDESNLASIDLEELETDFMNMSNVHRVHEKELKQFSEKEKYWIVRQKYFKENKINFLSWNDKEQIRFLNQSNPTEWTIEKLADGFPALPDTIKKILKNKWQLKNTNKQENHDKSVEKNWKLFKAGKFAEVLSSELRSHLSKFSNRKRNPDYDIHEYEEVVTKVEIPKFTEFSSIIKSYEELKTKTIPPKNIEPKKENIFLEDSSTTTPYGTTHVTLKLLQNKQNIGEKHIEKPQVTDVSDIALKKLFHGDKDAAKNKLKLRNSSSLTLNNQFGKKENDVIPYPERIIIPENKFRKGSTYKINDCYYDDDGEFLYRVPGMY